MLLTGSCSSPPLMRSYTNPLKVGGIGRGVGGDIDDGYHYYYEEEDGDDGYPLPGASWRPIARAQTGGDDREGISDRDRGEVALGDIFPGAKASPGSAQYEQPVHSRGVAGRPFACAWGIKLPGSNDVAKSGGGGGLLYRDRRGDKGESIRRDGGTAHSTGEGVEWKDRTGAGWMDLAFPACVLRDRDYAEHALDEYDVEVESVVGRASAALFGAIDRGALPSNAVVVFDIDGTLLSTDPFTKNEYLRVTGSPLTDPLGEASPDEEATFYPPIPATVALHNELRRMGVHTVLLTGRHEQKAGRTMANLRAAGVDTEGERVIFRGDQDVCLSMADYKRAKRVELARYFVVVATFGNRLSDVSGGNNGMGVLLPNRGYIVHRLV